MYFNHERLFVFVTNNINCVQNMNEKYAVIIVFSYTLIVYNIQCTKNKIMNINDCDDLNYYTNIYTMLDGIHW